MLVANLIDLDTMVLLTTNDTCESEGSSEDKRWQEQHELGWSQLEWAVLNFIPSILWCIYNVRVGIRSKLLR